VRVDPWDWNAQSFYPLQAALYATDVLRTTCRYTNVTDGTIRNGEQTSDEMCLDFVLVHPYAALLAAHRTTCVSQPLP
jgi:hypothetical protein